RWSGAPRKRATGSCRQWTMRRPGCAPHWSDGRRKADYFSSSLTLTPRFFSASRNRNSISALTLRSSCAARRSIAACSAGSSLRANAFLPGEATDAPSCSGVQRACVDHRLRIAIAAQDDQKVGDHGRLALIVELDDRLVRQLLQRVFDHEHG